MSWVTRDIFRPYPELLIFLTIAGGFVLGRLHWRSIGVGAVTGCLVMGLIMGQTKVPVNGTVKSVFFIMFLFALGFKVGPQFFRGLRKDGLPQVLLAVIVCVTGLLASYGFAKAAGYGPGLAAGLLGGALTQSAVIGVAQDAIKTLPHYTQAQITEQSNLVPVAYAVTYVLGTILCAILLATVLPRFLKQDLHTESVRLAEELDAGNDNPDEKPGYYEVVLRAFRITEPAFVGQSIEQFEQGQKDQDRRIYITRVRRDGQVVEHTQETVLAVGDVVAVSGLRASVVALDPVRTFGPETDDAELLAYETESLHVIVSGKNGVGHRGEKTGHIGQTIAELRREPVMVGVFIDKMYRAGFEYPYRLNTPIEKGDTLILNGPKRLVGGAAKAIGKPVPTSFATDMAWVGLGIFLGGCVGIPALKVSGVPVSLSTSGGALIMGLVFGWLRGRYPSFGNVPPGSQWFMDTFGLCAFVAIVGINAAPSFTSGLRQAGWGLLLWGAIITVIPLLVGFVVGHYVLKIRLPLLMANLAGAQTTTAAIGAINEAAGSNLPTLGYTVPYAVGNVLLTIWGSIIVLLVH